MTDTQTHLTALVAIDQRGAISRGRSYPSTARVTIDLAPLGDFERAWLAARWEPKDGSLRYRPIGECNSGNLLLISDPAPEAVLALIALDKAEHDRKAALLATRVERATAALREKPTEGWSEWYYCDRAFAVREWYDVSTHTHVPPSEWPADVRLLVEQSAAEAKAKFAEEQRLDRKKREAKEAEAAAAQAAQDARTLQHLDPEESAMHARGYLDLTAVRSRLDSAAIDILRAKIEPPGYEIDTSYRRDEAKPSSREEWRALRRIEQLSGLGVRRVSHDTYQTELATADGRTITVEITPAE